MCNTDHHLVCAKLRLRCWKRTGGGAKDKRFKVEKLTFSKEGENAVRDEKVLERANGVRMME